MNIEYISEGFKFSNQILFFTTILFCSGESSQIYINFCYLFLLFKFSYIYTTDTRWTNTFASRWIINRINVSLYCCIIPIKFIKADTPKSYGTPSRFNKVSSYIIYIYFGLNMCWCIMKLCELFLLLPKNRDRHIIDSLYWKSMLCWCIGFVSGILK